MSSRTKRAAEEHAGAMEPKVILDYPRQGEIVTSQGYTLRITTLEPAESVDVCIDQGTWRPCRKSVGYWWYDWSGYESGVHDVKCRAKFRSGRTEVGPSLRFHVDVKDRAPMAVLA